LRGSVRLAYAVKVRTRSAPDPKALRLSATRTLGSGMCPFRTGLMREVLHPAGNARNRV